MPSAELIAIGTELLLGEIQDTNSRFLALQLRALGIDLFRTTCIGDNPSRVASAVKEALARADIVITTGGLGPTIDDPTREAIAMALDTILEYHPELWESIEQRFLSRGIKPTKNNQRQAYVPAGASIIPNPVGTAPAFYFFKNKKVVISLPGVPAEMEKLFKDSAQPLLKSLFDLDEVIKVRVLHISGLGESVVDEQIKDLEKSPNPTVGLLAHPGIVDVRITAKAGNQAQADRMIGEIETKITPLFTDDIFGFDDQTLAQSVEGLSARHHLHVKIYGCGLDGLFSFTQKNDSTISCVYAPLPCDLQDQTKQSRSVTSPGSLELDFNYFQNNGNGYLEYVLRSPDSVISDTIIYNGPQVQAPIWAVNRVLDLIRRKIISSFR